MRKKTFNYLVRNRLEKFITIALFLVLGSLNGAEAAASTSLDIGTIACPGPSATAPIWGKLVLSGNTVTCFYGFGSVAPTVWKQFGQPKTINFINNPILVGIYVTSHDSTLLSGGTIDNFSITPTPTYRLADYDIGSPAFMGSANLLGGVWSIAGSGSDIGGVRDQCNFQSWLVWSDCTVVCRITSLSAGNPFQKIGLMIRDGFNSGSDYAMFCAKMGGIDYQYRYSFNNNPDITEFVAPPMPGEKSSVAVGYGLTGGTSYTLRP